MGLGKGDKNRMDWEGKIRIGWNRGFSYCCLLGDCPRNEYVCVCVKIKQFSRMFQGVMQVCVV
jgi:hypothetical protein